MAAYTLSATVDTTYPDGADPSIKQHQQDHDKIHGFIDRFDTTVTGSTMRQTLAADANGIFVPAYAQQLMRYTKTVAYTLVLSDAFCVIEYNSSSGATFTLPTIATVGYGDGTWFIFRQCGTGQLTIAGTQLRSRGAAYNLAGQFAEATCTVRSTTDYYLVGDVVV